MEAENIFKILSEILQVTDKLKTKLKSRKEEATRDTRDTSGDSEKTQDDSAKTCGISLLNVRNLTLCSYLKKLIFFILLKINGKAISSSPVNGKAISSSQAISSSPVISSSQAISSSPVNGKAISSSPVISSSPDDYNNLVWFLVKDRFILEKTNSIKEKLKYQIDKLLKLAAAANPNANAIALTNVETEEMDPLAFKPNPTAMMENQYHDNESQVKDNDGIYRPPRVAPVHYDIEKSASKNRLSEKQKEIASRSRLLRDLQSQYDERPEDIDAAGTGYDAKISGSKLDKEWQEREAFEEENFIRLTTSKKMKNEMKKLQKQGGVLRFNDELNDLKRDFRELRGVHDAVEKDYDAKPKQGSRKEKLIKGEQEEEGSKKRGFEHVDQLISKMASQRRSEKGKDKFTRDKRFAKKVRK